MFLGPGTLQARPGVAESRNALTQQTGCVKGTQESREHVLSGSGWNNLPGK